ncbi:hypothetical protein ACQKO6_17595 [Pseudomonas monteilii]
MATDNRSSSNHATRTFTLDSLTTAVEQVQALILEALALLKRQLPEALASASGGQR